MLNTRSVRGKRGKKKSQMIYVFKSSAVGGVKVRIGYNLILTQLVSAFVWLKKHLNTGTRLSYVMQ